MTSSPVHGRVNPASRRRPRRAPTSSPHCTDALSFGFNSATAFVYSIGLATSFSAWTTKAPPPLRRAGATALAALRHDRAQPVAATTDARCSVPPRRRDTVRGHHPGVEFGLRVELQCQGAEHLLAVFCVSTSAVTPRRSPRHAPPVLVAATGHGDRDQHFLLVTKSANSGSTSCCSRPSSLRRRLLGCDPAEHLHVNLSSHGSGEHWFPNYLLTLGKSNHP
jgi:hypothetical protein